MKINQDEGFKPITITLETEDEVIKFLAIIKWGSSKQPENLKNLTARISNTLSELLQ